MPILHVRNVPARLHERLRRLAASRDRSLGAEVVALLGRALEEESVRRSQARLLAGVRRRRARVRTRPGAPDSAVLLREDRGR